MSDIKKVTINVDLRDAVMPEKKGLTYIYLIEGIGTGLVKIGLTNDIERRFAQLVGENAGKLKMVAYQVGTAEDERAAHALCKEHRAHGEWFHDHPDIRRLFT